MKKIIEIPEEVEISKENSKIEIVGPKGKTEKEFKHPKVKVEIDDEILIKSESDKKKERAVVGAYTAHIRNMIKGVKEGFEYRLKSVYKHFPMSLEVKGNKMFIKNFLGERKPRVVKIIGNIDVEIKDDEIILTGADIEALGQTAANIESATKVKDKDRRIFADGIFITMKKGEKL